MREPEEVVREVRGEPGDSTDTEPSRGISRGHGATGLKLADLQELRKQESSEALLVPTWKIPKQCFRTDRAMQLGRWCVYCLFVHVHCLFVHVGGRVG